MNGREIIIDAETAAAIAIGLSDTGKTDIFSLTGTIIKAWCIKHGASVYDFMEELAVALDHAEKFDREVFENEKTN